jgi:hypothetical protein
MRFAQVYGVIEFQFGEHGVHPSGLYRAGSTGKNKVRRLVVARRTL